MSTVLFLVTGFLYAEILNKILFAEIDSSCMFHQIILMHCDSKQAFSLVVVVILWVSKPIFYYSFGANFVFKFV